MDSYFEEKKAKVGPIYDEMRVDFNEKVLGQISAKEMVEQLSEQLSEKLGEKEIITTEELIIENSYRLDVVTQLLIEKGIITAQEFITKLKEIQAE